MAFQWGGVDGSTGGGGVSGSDLSDWEDSWVGISSWVGIGSWVSVGGWVDGWDMGSPWEWSSVDGWDRGVLADWGCVWPGTVWVDSWALGNSEEGDQCNGELKKTIVYPNCYQSSNLPTHFHFDLVLCFVFKLTVEKFELVWYWLGFSVLFYTPRKTKEKSSNLSGATGDSKLAKLQQVQKRTTIFVLTWEYRNNKRT
jgi:hypothetical protein